MTGLAEQSKAILSSDTLTKFLPNYNASIKETANEEGGPPGNADYRQLNRMNEVSKDMLRQLSFVARMFYNLIVQKV